MNDPGARKKILIVEDSEPFREIYRDLLQSFGHEILEAEDGERGLEIAQTDKPDLIFLDVLLPGIDGLETLQRIRAEKSTLKIPVVVLTAMDSYITCKKAIELGATECFVKGLNSNDEILRLVGAIMDEV